MRWLLCIDADVLPMTRKQHGKTKYNENVENLKALIPDSSCLSGANLLPVFDSFECMYRRRPIMVT